MKKLKKNQGKSLEKKLAGYKEQAVGLSFKIKKYSPAILSGSVFLMGMPVAEAAIIQTIVNQTVNSGNFNIDINNDAINDAILSVTSTAIFLNGDADGPMGTVPPMPQVGTGSLYPSVLAVGFNVNAGANFLTGANHVEVLSTSSGSNGKWIGNPIKGYIGFSIQISGNTHFGWIELWVTSQDNGDNEVEIKRWAYENVAGTSITTPPLTVLPVELTDFTARPTPEAVRLNWKTQSETNNAGFQIERSEDGKKFQKIKWVDGHGTTLEAQEYLFDDKNLRTGKTYYYRLRQVDYNGQFEYSGIVSIILEGGKNTVGEFYPNPAPNGLVSVDFNAEEEGEWTVSVFEMSGKEIRRFEKYIGNGIDQMQLDISGFTEGMYFVKFEQGSEIFYRKITVQ